MNKVFVITKRELGSYFSSPLAYIIISVNAILLAATFFKGLFLGYNFFLYKSVDLRILFLFQAVLLTLFVPIITMKLFAEEKRTLTIEPLMALPVTEEEVAIAKLLAAFLVTAAVLIPDVIIVILVGLCGSLDASAVIAGLLGLLLLSLTFCSVGLWGSSLARTQNVALFISLPLTAVFMAIYVPFSIPKGVPVFIDAAARFLSSFEHFSAITHGVLDLKDIVYFLSVAGIFFFLTVLHQKKTKL